jgi:hypothetical protein
MTAGGRAMSSLTLLRIENGARVPTLDEALALAYLLGTSLAHLLSPSEGLVWLTDKFGVDAAAMRNILLFGDPLLLSATGRRVSLRIQLVHALEVHAQALVDAKRGGDSAGVHASALALRDLIEAHLEQMNEVGDDSETEAS